MPLMLTALDIVVLVLIGGGLLLGAIKGFVAEALSLFAWFAAVFVLIVALAARERRRRAVVLGR